MNTQAESLATNTAPHQRPVRVDALDGLRAIAVVAVVLYHADPSLLPGGFLGVDLFFVLSGYLITSLIWLEHQRPDGFGLREFWFRRMRRLWPLAWVTLAAIAVASLWGVWGLDRQRSLPKELLAGFIHLANWYQIDHGGYVQSFTAPSPVRHFWSLAIEEQFYLVWPALLALLWRGNHPRGRLREDRREEPKGMWTTWAVLGCLILASLYAGWRQADHLDRAYLGSDVRAVALLVGATMAVAGRSRPFSGAQSAVLRRALVGAGLLGGAALVYGALVVHTNADWLPKGGFGIAAIAAGTVMAAVLNSSLLSRLIGWPPLAAFGRRSFALYLVHWPLLVAIGPGRPAWVRILVGLPVSSILAAWLHRVIEQPIIRHQYSTGRLLVSGVLGVTVAVASLVIAVPAGTTPTEQVNASLGQVPDPELADPAPANSQPTGSSSAATVPCVPSGQVPTPSQTPPVSEDGGFQPDTVRPVEDPIGSVCDEQLNVLIVGDSTGRGAANGLVGLGDPRLRVWDRTELGCSLGDETCPDWHELWSNAVTEIQPDVVVMYLGVVSDLYGIEDAKFDSDQAATDRLTTLNDAVELLAKNGATVFLVTVADPLPPKGLFFCQGEARNSRCDPKWVSLWNEAVLRVAQEQSAEVLDVRGWIEERGSSTSDRPDGLHLAGTSLQELADWIRVRLGATKPN